MNAQQAKEDVLHIGTSGPLIASIPGESAIPVRMISGMNPNSTTVYAAFCSGLYVPCGGGSLRK